MGLAFNELMASWGLWQPFQGNWVMLERFVLVSVSWCLFVIAALTPYLYKRLIPLFDERFRHLVPKHHEYFTSFHKFSRMGSYVAWVVSTRIFARGQPAVQAHDFSGDVSPRVRKVCWVYLVHGMAFILISFIFLAAQFLNGWING